MSNAGIANKVTLVGEGMQSHPELENVSADGIGFLKLHKETDYEPVSGITFSEHAWIDLGLYAPLGETGNSINVFAVVALYCCV